jgi:hypothetical protein
VHVWGAQVVPLLTRSHEHEAPRVLQLINNQLPVQVLRKYAALFHCTVNRRVVGELPLSLTLCAPADTEHTLVDYCSLLVVDRCAPRYDGGSDAIQSRLQEWRALLHL